MAHIMMMTGVKSFLAGLLIVLSGIASADSWVGADKTLHLTAGYFIGGGTTLMTESPKWGAATGCAVGVGKEINDRRVPGNESSFKDAAVTCLGSVLGAYTGHVLLYKTNEGYRLEFNKKF